MPRPKNEIAEKIDVDRYHDIEIGQRRLTLMNEIAQVTRIVHKGNSVNVYARVGEGTHRRLAVFSPGSLKRRPKKGTK